MTESPDQPADKAAQPASDMPWGQPAPVPVTAGGYPASPPYPYPAGYPQPYPDYGPPPTAPKNGLGIAALVIAALGLLVSPSVLGGIILGVVAVVLGFTGRRRARRGEANNGGVATAGVVLGFLAVAASVAFIFIYLSLFKSSGGQDYVHCMDRAGSNPVSQQKCADQFREQLKNRFGIPATPQPPG